MSSTSQSLFREEQNSTIAYREWKDKEITILIKLWEEFLPAFRKYGRNPAALIDLSQRFNEEACLELDDQRTHVEIKAKIEGLKRQYRYFFY